MHHPIPKFIIDKESLFDKIFEKVKVFSGKKRDINFVKYAGFSSKFQLRGEDEEAIREFFTEDLICFFRRKRDSPYRKQRRNIDDI